MSLEKEVAELIASEVGWFNGWKASEEMFDKSCRKAAQKVIKRLTKHALDGGESAPLEAESTPEVLSTSQALPKPIRRR